VRWLRMLSNNDPKLCTSRIWTVHDNNHVFLAAGIERPSLSPCWFLGTRSYRGFPIKKGGVVHISLLTCGTLQLLQVRVKAA
jgi:hypothetical protein